MEHIKLKDEQTASDSSDVMFEEALQVVDQKTQNDVDATQIYLNEMGAHPLLTAEEELETARLVAQGDEAARQKMIVSNLRLVVKIARSYLRQGHLLLDLIEEGNLGLMHAVEKFDPERGFRFSTYATWWIRHHIERSMMNQSRSVRLPVHVTKEMNTYLHAAHKLTQVLGRQASCEEIAECLDRPIEDVLKILQHNTSVTSLDMPVAQASNKSLAEVISDEDQMTPEESAACNDASEKIALYVEKLSEIERTVLSYRFGLDGHEVLSLVEISETVSLTRERLRQIYHQAIKNMRALMEADGFDFDFDGMMDD